MSATRSSATHEQGLARALHHGVVVIAVCDPVYFTRDVRAQEWFAGWTEHERRPRVIAATETRGMFIYCTTQPVFARWRELLATLFDYTIVFAHGG